MLFRVYGTPNTVLNHSKTKNKEIDRANYLQATILGNKLLELLIRAGDGDLEQIMSTIDLFPFLSKLIMLWCCFGSGVIGL